MKSARDARFDSEVTLKESGAWPWRTRARPLNGIEAMGQISDPTKIPHQRSDDSIACGDMPLFDQKSFYAKFGGVSTANYQTKQAVYAQGAAADSIFFVQHGKVKLTRAAESGKQAVIAMLGTGEFCGTDCLSGHRTHFLSAQAATECSIARLRKSAVRKAIDEDPSFARRIISHLSNLEIRLQEALADQLCNSSEQRLARLLVGMADHENSGWGKLLSPRIDQATLGNMVGTTRQRINFFLNKFRLAGHIACGDGIRVNASLQDVVRL